MFFGWRCVVIRMMNLRFDWLMKELEIYNAIILDYWLISTKKIYRKYSGGSYIKYKLKQGEHPF